MTAFDDDDFDRLETEEQTREPRPKSGFAYALDACGLSTEEAMQYLGQSRSAIEKKRSGALSSTFEDGRALSRLWHDIRSGRVDENLHGPFAMAATMLVLSGRRAPETARRGRPPMVPRGSDMTPAELQRHRAGLAMRSFIEHGGRAPDEAA